jgi:glycosyltransferase involved in cell wall biosynthesis
VNATAGSSTHITGLFPELLGVGGIQEAGRMTALAMQEIARSRGWTANFLALNDRPDARGTVEQFFTVDGRTVGFRGFGRSKVRLIAAAVASGRKAHHHTHIILAGHPNLSPIAVWLQKMSPMGHAIVVAHGIEVWQPLPLLRRATIRRAQMVAAPSADTFQKLTDVQHVERKRARLLPWPLNPEFLRLADAKNLPEVEGFPPQGRVILTIGRAASAEQYKGTDDVIRAVARLRSANPDLHLVCVGGGDDLPRLRALADQTGGGDRIHFLHDLSREQLAACYAACDVFAMPSAGEGFGLVFLEAMAFGKPVVAAAFGGALDVVHDGVNGVLVPPRNATVLASALSRLLANPQLRQSLGAKGAAMAREKYRFEAFSARLEAFFAECTPEKTRSMRAASAQK